MGMLGFCFPEIRKVHQRWQTQALGVALLQPISWDDIEIYTQIVRNPHVAFHFSCALPARGSGRDGVIIQASWTGSRRRL